MFEEIYKILVEFLGESKQGGYDRETYQYQFGCPRCIDEYGEDEALKYHLDINIKDGIFKCWKCVSQDEDMQGKLGKLIKMYGSADLYKRYKEAIKSIKESHLYELSDFSGLTISFEANTYVRLPKTFRHININKCHDKRLLEYLEKRKINQEFIDKFSLGYTTWDEEDYSMRNRIIIPSYDEFGDLNYYLGRDYTGKSKLRYKNCDADKKEIVFQESLINWDSTIYLCEGSFDAMRFPSNGIAMLGKSLGNEYVLYKKIMERANADVVIVLDGDTAEIETKKLYKLLNVGRLFGKVKYIDLWNGISPYKDMSEIYEHDGKKGILNVLKQVKQYNEIDLIY